MFALRDAGGEMSRSRPTFRQKTRSSCIRAGAQRAPTFGQSFGSGPDTYCYFEPLNEHLLTATAEVIDGFRPWSFANHPSLDAPYLEEFRPLIGPGGGVPGFPAHLTFGRYCAASDDSLPELEAYLADLARLATRLGRRPVYGFVRTDMRTGWFRARMPGTHIFIRREPRRQFLSMLRQAVQGNPYFLQRGVVILRHNMEAPAFAPLLSALEFPEVELPPLLDSSGLATPSGASSWMRQFCAGFTLSFYCIWLLARQLGEPQCHLVIDIDRLSLDDSYRREIENRLGDLVGMAISFADCRVERYDENLSWSGPQFEALERDVEALVGLRSAIERRDQPAARFVLRRRIADGPIPKAPSSRSR